MVFSDILKVWILKIFIRRRQCSSSFYKQILVWVWRPRHGQRSQDSNSRVVGNIIVKRVNYLNFLRFQNVFFSVKTSYCSNLSRLSKDALKDFVVSRAKGCSTFDLKYFLFDVVKRNLNPVSCKIYDPVVKIEICRHVTCRVQCKYSAKEGLIILEFTKQFIPLFLLKVGVGWRSKVLVHLLSFFTF